MRIWRSLRLSLKQPDTRRFCSYILHVWANYSMAFMAIWRMVFANRQHLSGEIPCGMYSLSASNHVRISSARPLQQNKSYLLQFFHLSSPARVMVHFDRLSAPTILGTQPILHISSAVVASLSIVCVSCNLHHGQSRDADNSTS